MKRLCALLLGGFLLLAQMFYLTSSPLSSVSGTPSRCCLLRQSIAVEQQSGSPLDSQHASLVRACCSHSCCAQAPAPIAQTVPVAPVSPEVPRVLPNVLVMTFLWALPPAPALLGSPTPYSSGVAQDPAVPLITRHCTLLI